MDEQLENRLRFLRKSNTEGMPHTDRGLLDHLLGTRQLFVEWEARPALCDAGLFHSVYGTENYELQAIPLTMRNEVQQLIGDEAESLAWLFCIIRRETLYENPGCEGEFRVQHGLTDEWRLGRVPPRVPAARRHCHGHLRGVRLQCLELPRTAPQMLTPHIAIAGRKTSR